MKKKVLELGGYRSEITITQTPGLMSLADAVMEFKKGEGVDCPCKLRKTPARQSMACVELAGTGATVPWLENNRRCSAEDACVCDAVEGVKRGKVNG